MDLVFERNGEYWSIGRGAELLRLRDTKGLRYIDQLLRHPETELHAVDLVRAAEGASPESRTADRSFEERGGIDATHATGEDAGEVLDPQARRAYTERLKDLREEIEEAESFNDPERVALAKQESELLSRELASAFGLGGAPRRAGSVSERARVNVTRAIKSAIDRVVEGDESVGRYLSATIRTGTFCSYTPLASDQRPTGVTRVVVADDSVLFREGLVRVLSERGFEVAAQAGDAEELLQQVEAERPDVAIVDMRMPPTRTDEGLRAAGTLFERHPDVGVLMLSQQVEPHHTVRLLEQRSDRVGYLLKDRVTDLNMFASAVRRVGEGGSAVDPAVVVELVGRLREGDPLAELSGPEREVLALMAEGRSNHAIARRLSVDEDTVESRARTIFRKLGLADTPDDHRRVVAVLRFLRA